MEEQGGCEKKREKVLRDEQCFCNLTRTNAVGKKGALEREWRIRSGETEGPKELAQLLGVERKKAKECNPVYEKRERLDS